MSLPVMAEVTSSIYGEQSKWMERFARYLNDTKDFEANRTLHEVIEQFKGQRKFLFLKDEFANKQVLERSFEAGERNWSSIYEGGIYIMQNYTTLIFAAKPRLNKYYYWETVQSSIALIIFLMTIIGNLSIIIRLRSCRRRRSNVNYFILQLALADFFVGMFSITMDTIFRALQAFPFGQPICLASKYISNFFIYASTYLLVALSIDRWEAVVKPLAFTQNRNRGHYLAAGAWLLAVLGATPVTLLSGLREIDGVPQCWINLETLGWKLYMIYLTCSLLAIPGLIIAVCYSHIVFTIWAKGRQRQPKINSYQRQFKRQQQQQLQQQQQQHNVQKVQTQAQPEEKNVRASQLEPQQRVAGEVELEELNDANRRRRKRRIQCTLGERAETAPINADAKSIVQPTSVVVENEREDCSSRNTEQDYVSTSDDEIAPAEVSFDDDCNDEDDEDDDDYPDYDKKEMRQSADRFEMQSIQLDRGDEDKLGSAGNMVGTLATIKQCGELVAITEVGDKNFPAGDKHLGPKAIGKGEGEGEGKGENANELGNKSATNSNALKTSANKLPSIKMAKINCIGQAHGSGVIPLARIKTIKMTLVIVAVFILSWSPFYIINLCSVFGWVNEEETNYWIALKTLSQSLAHLNSAVNPIIFWLFSSRRTSTLTASSSAANGSLAVSRQAKRTLRESTFTSLLRRLCFIRSSPGPKSSQSDSLQKARLKLANFKTPHSPAKVN